MKKMLKVKTKLGDLLPNSADQRDAQEFWK